MQSLIEKRGLTNDFCVDSCGMSSYYLGKNADSRMRLAAETKGYRMMDHRAKLFEMGFFHAFDYIFAVDEEILRQLKDLSGGSFTGKLYLVSEFSQEYHGEDMPDPFYLGSEGFVQTVLMAEDCCKGILDWVLLKK